ncbi:MAG: SPFH domain-containing protein [Planctomycetota bacterium]|nr:SPFH domain-containing protein [Planctomycetota bacterium]
MSIWDRLKKELIDIVQYLDDTNTTLVHRFERFQNEIKNGAKLVVREGQQAVFIEEGKLADVFGPGTYTLDTKNLPILATLKGWKYGFESPFKAEVYFCSTRRFNDLKWGTMNPVILRDKEFGPIRVRAFGSYSIRISDPAAFIRQVVGTDGTFTVDEIQGQLRNTLVSRLGDLLGESKLGVVDFAANYNELGEFLTKKMAPEFAAMGLELPQLLVENISLPPEVEKALDKRSSMGVIGDMRAYTQFQTAEAIGKAAENPGSAGTFMAMGLGNNLGGMMAGQMAGAQMAGMHGGGPPPLGGGFGGGMTAPVPFFIALNGQQAGPFMTDVLQQMASSGQLRPDTLVWRQGLSNWMPANQVPELGGLFGPPMPGGVGGGAGGPPPLPRS